MPDLAVLVLTKTPAYFREMQRSVRDQVVFARGFVMNNAPRPSTDHDAIRELARRYEWVHGTFGQNVSYSQGNNALAHQAIRRGHTHLVLLNDDAVLAPDALEALDTAIRHDPKAIVGALLVEADGKRVNHAGHDPRLGDPHIGRGMPASTFRGGGIASAPCVTFAFAAVPAALWQELGGLDEGYVYGYEDTDFCLRARERGARIVVQRNAEAVHGECGTRPRGGAQDVMNAKRFQARWGHRLGELL